MNSAFVIWLLDRLGEASTWAGIGTFVAGMTFIPAADLSMAVKITAMAGTLIPSIIAMAKKG